MILDDVLNKLNNILDEIVSNSSEYVTDPQRDMKRKRKLPMRQMLERILLMGGGTLHNELLDFPSDSDIPPSTPAFVQQRDKLKIEAFETIFRNTSGIIRNPISYDGYRLIAVDGSDIHIPLNRNDAETFVFMPVFGLTQGALPILGYNFGARDRDRFMHTYKLALRVALIIMGAGLLCFQLFPDMLLSIFNATDQMYDIGDKALRIISICFLPAAYGITTSTVFQATGHGVLSLWSSLIRQLVGALPVAIILSKIIGLTGVWLAFPLAEVLGTGYVICAFIWLYKREIKTMGIDNR